LEISSSNRLARSSAFQQAIRGTSIKAVQCVYPIKVNQQRQVVEESWTSAARYHFGLRPAQAELLAVIALALQRPAIVCNGFKDDEFIETAMLAKDSAGKSFMVVEKYTDLGHSPKAEEVGVRRRSGSREARVFRGPEGGSPRGASLQVRVTVSEILPRLGRN